ncbi:restriction endonuclease subunit S [Ligilactobacillus salivarius]|uniref:restriction endonuclease subunit S n=1 Tax=Ligilactobacillus salivarius TaxID=1624 RepID=UPI0025A47453|nr:restriction endonuclease subunit S [Ligilactobacillus salivarius]MDM8263481.1 restriction endonuclease subunit S [Ligilactobacillus salivarius]
MDNKKNGIPKLRFPGFTGAWEQRKLGEVVNIFSGWSPSNFKEGDSGSDIFIKVDDLNYSTREQLNSQMNVLESQKYKKIPKGSTIFPKRGAAIMTNKVRILGKSAYMDTNMMALEASDISSEFLYTFITKTGLFKIADTSTIPQINNKHINPYPIKLPTMPEQKQIGKFFKQVDSLIALHQRKLKHLQEQKKGLLQKMFPKNGETVPEVRFPGFTDAWEQRKLGEMSHIETGKLDANAMVKNGKYDFYTSGIKKYHIDTPAFKGPAITIAGNGATVGYMHLADGEFNAYQRTYVLTKFSANRSFIFIEIGNKLPRKIQQESRAGNIPYIVMDMLTDLKIVLPSLAEQEKIGNFFNELNSLITLHQRKLDHLELMKKGLLQQMFV